MKIKYATIDGLLCIEYTKFIKGQTSITYIIKIIINK